MIKPASKAKLGRGPAKAGLVAEGRASAAAKAGSRGISGISGELGLARGRKAASTADLLTRIVREQHVVLGLRQGQSLQRFSRKNFSPAIRNGLASRAFSRTKLDAFVAVAQEKTPADLLGRIQLCGGQKKRAPPTPRPQADALKLRLGQRQARAAELAGLNQSASLLPQRTSQRPPPQTHASLKSLLEARPEDPQFHEESGLSRHPAKTRSGSKAAVQLLGSPARPLAVFPKTYKVLVREDRQILSRFGCKPQLSDGSRFSPSLQGRREDRSACK